MTGKRSTGTEVMVGKGSATCVWFESRNGRERERYYELNATHLHDKTEMNEFFPQLQCPPAQLLRPIGFATTPWWPQKRFKMLQKRRGYHSWRGSAPSPWKLSLWCRALDQQVQKERCLQIMDLIQHLLCALMDHSIYSEEIQSPGMLERITECTVTLQKIDSFLRAQQDLGVIKRMFKKSEITAQLQCCEIKLKDALSNFTVRHSTGHQDLACEAHYLWKINQGSGLALALMEFNIDSEERHQEFLELMSSQSGSFDGLSSLGSLYQFCSCSLAIPDWTKFLEYQVKILFFQGGCPLTPFVASADSRYSPRRQKYSTGVIPSLNIWLKAFSQDLPELRSWAPVVWATQP
ncbi:hypothetical protein K438DRAFT_1786578 [Mycena galopus ATCC 62051]|nr:hypothetical protein K438DRAFT_1786578 [Mycena galopus ATCC 62051]